MANAAASALEHQRRAVAPSLRLTAVQPGVHGTGLPESVSPMWMLGPGAHNITSHYICYVGYVGAIVEVDPPRLAPSNYS